jgi:hypothetical protein
MHCVLDNTKGNQYCFCALIVSLDFVILCLELFQDSHVKLDSWGKVLLHVCKLKVFSIIMLQGS